MKGLILAAGKGTRLRPLTYTTPKPLLPIANRPTIVYAIDAMRNSGITDIGVVVGEQGDKIAAAFGDGAQHGVRLAYIPQEEPRGLGHAVACAEAFIARHPFMLYLGDTLFDMSLTDYIRPYTDHPADALIVVAPVTEPSRYGIAELDGDRVVRLEEKPAAPRSNLALTGLYIFGSRLWDVMPSLTPSARGELEITDAIQLLVESDAEVRSAPYTGWWQDSGTPDFMLQANDYWLSNLKPENLADAEPAVQISGPLHIGRGTHLLGNTAITGPCVIGQWCLIENSIVGPNCSIADGVIIRNSRISRSIVLPDTRIEAWTSPIRDAIIGARCQLRSEPDYSIVGDDTSLCSND